MDKLLVSLGQARKASGFEGTLDEFKQSKALLAWALKNGRVVRLQPHEMPRLLKEKYTNHLVALTRQYLSNNPEVNSWQAFSQKKENRSIHKLLHQFGVRGEVFGIESFQAETAEAADRSPTGITIEEIHELYQIQFHFNGTLAAFKRAIQRKYGSFAEFCIIRGYDINTTKWEDDEAAVRVARRLGSISEVEKRSHSLHRYLTDKGLVAIAFKRPPNSSEDRKDKRNVERPPSEDLWLSKSKITAGMQCSKRLYLSIFSPDLGAPVDSSKQAIFDQGHEVGVAAQKNFPGGVLIDSPYYDADTAIAQTESAIKSGIQTLYEPAFLHNQVMIRVDILHRSSVSAPWQLIEVKSTTSVKDQHIQDAAIQAWVLRGLGHEIESVSIVHLNNQFVHPNNGDLFTRTDVTSKIEETVALIPSLLEGLSAKLKQVKPPEIDLGPHCSEPYDCEFQSHCRSARKVPDISVLDIPGLSSKRKWALYKNGILKVDDPRLTEEKFNSLQERMLEVSKTGIPSIDAAGIAAALNEWTYPLYFLDFETINPAIPRYKGTRPYQQLPFQFSCQIQKQPGATLVHREYLHDQDTDPRRSLVEALVGSIGPEGSIVSYNKGFEANCLNDLATTFPEYSAALSNIRYRLVDPLPIIKGNVYHKLFNGSFSIKDVAPALLGKSMSYEGMPVSNGTDAQIAYYKLVSDTLSRTARLQLKREMLEYCRKDTLAMVKLVEWLYGVGDRSTSAERKQPKAKTAA